MTRHEFFTGIADRIQDAESRLTDDIKEACMNQALKEYSQQRPLANAVELTADGTSWLDLPDDWLPEFSRVRRIDRTLLGEPVRVSAQDYSIRRQTDGTDKLLWLYDIPEYGAIITLTYTVLHTISDSTSSYSSGDDESLMDLAASHAALRLAAAHIDDVDPDLGTVNLDNKTKSDRYRSLAKDLYTQYKRGVGATGRSRMTAWQTDRSYVRGY